MENDFVPKDVALTKIKECDVTSQKTGVCIFKGFSINIRQELSIISNGRSTAPNIFLDMGGQVQKYFNNVNTSELIDFSVKIIRTDVIEILKFGQYITLKGSGFVSNITSLDNGDSWKIIINVSGEIKIK